MAARERGQRGEVGVGRRGTNGEGDGRREVCGVCERRKGSMRWCDYAHNGGERWCGPATRCGCARSRPCVRRWRDGVVRFVTKWRHALCSRSGWRGWRDGLCLFCLDPHREAPLPISFPITIPSPPPCLGATIVPCLRATAALRALLAVDDGSNALLSLWPNDKVESCCDASHGGGPFRR